MSIIADRGLFVRLPVQSGRLDLPGAESFADAATREPATKQGVTATRSDVMDVRNGLEVGIALLNQRFDSLEKGLDGCFGAQSDRLMIRLGGPSALPSLAYSSPPCG